MKRLFGWKSEKKMSNELINHLIMNIKRPKVLFRDIYFNIGTSQSKCWDRFFDAILRHDIEGYTFFITGVCAKEQEVQVQNIVKQGFFIGSHGFRHLPYWQINDAEEDLRKSKDILNSFGVKISGFRPPNLIEPPHDTEFLERNGYSIYQLADKLGFKYISSQFQKNGEFYDENGVKEIPINRMDWYYIYREGVSSANTLFRKFAEELRDGDVFLLHPNLTGQKKFISAFDSLLELDFRFISVEQWLKGDIGVILTSDIATFSTIELLKRLLK